jgi:hypothetical protein
MAKPTSDTEPTIEELLEQRTQYEEWLAKLDSSGDKAPPAVRQRVRGDYEARLQSVMEQLRGRGAAIGEELERHHASQAELDRERRAAEEALAEAEVRHSVGEYTADEWRQLNEQSRREIEQLKAKLRGVGAEITRLSEVQALITAPRAGAAPLPPPPTPAPRPARPEVIEQAPMVTHVSDPMAEPQSVQSPNLTARPAEAEPPPPVPVPPDELAFLKSVGSEDTRPIGRRTSNPGIAAQTAISAPPQTAAPTVGKAPAGVAKTLKCGECGTLNRPTEWYCERCGAELASL